jgi:methyl-accepting chemotaxis protein
MKNQNPLNDKSSQSPQKSRGLDPKGFARGISGMRLQTRLTVLILLVAIPVLLASTYLTNLLGREIIEQQAADQLRLTNSTIARDTSTQMNFSVQILNQLALMPDIMSMDPLRQKPVLKAVNTVNPDFYLIHTLDLAGINVARSDDVENKDYHDRKYFQIPANGGPVTFQTVKGKTSGQPALTIGTAIRDAGEKIIGVLGVAIDLTEMSTNVQASKVGQTGFVFIVDQGNLVVAHPDPTYTDELVDLSTYPPVAMMRQGNLGLV